MRYIKRTLIFALASLSFASLGYAQETPEPTVEPARAVWLEPSQVKASWIDTSENGFSPATPEILVKGQNIAIAKLSDGQLYAVDSQLRILKIQDGENAEIVKPIPVPSGVQWLTLDEKDRILMYNEGKLYLANSYKEPEFTPIMDIPDLKFFDSANDTLVYGDNTQLTLVDLATGSMRQIPLTDFFDEAKVAAMTPEAVQAAEEAAAKKKSKTKKTTKKAEEEEQPSQVADIQGIWWRSDGIGVIRVRSLTNMRTFVTRDNGKSWTLDDNAPQKLIHSFGWIWNGTDQVLSKDGTTWVKMCPNAVTHNMANLLIPGHTLKASAPSMPDLPNWMVYPSPSEDDEDTGLFSKNEETGELCVLSIPKSKADLPQSSTSPASVYAPQSHGGVQFGILNNARAATEDQPGIPPTFWTVQNQDAGFVTWTLDDPDAPVDCAMPIYADSIQGLSILMCDNGIKENVQQTVVYTSKDGRTGWTAETLLDDHFRDLGDDSTYKLMAAEDGTIILTGKCQEESGPAPELSEEEIASGATAREPVIIPNVCYYAVRNPDESLPNNERWRIERVENATSIVPLTGARMLSVEDHGSSNAQSLVLRTPLSTEKIVESFDPTPYSGLVETHEGCLALYDGSVDAQTLANAQSGYTNPETGEYVAGSNVKLLSVNGTQAGLDCAQSRLIVESGMGQTEYVEEPEGDPRFGVRIGGGAMFSTKDVITWVMRVEALIPIYRGKYEVGLLYRMSGGNESSATGHMGVVAMRWRYDDFEKFDFAAGAGIGYGQACGYDKSSDKNALDDDDSTKPSAFRECHDLSMRYLISGIATYKLAKQWKFYLAAEMLGGSSWGVDLNAGIEVRF